MSKFSTNDMQTKLVVTVTEMAQMVGLSRSRFYQLVRAGVFPWPVYGLLDRRAHYIEELQRVCLQVRAHNCGINGRPVFFYARRIGSVVSAPKLRAKSPNKSANAAADHGTVFLGVLGLGVSVTPEDVATAIKAEYPTGTQGVSDAEIIRRVFLRIQRRDSGNSVQR